jgi:ankyrin repeat protein
MVEQLLNRGISPNLEGDKIALIEAVIQNDMTMLRMLLEYGADPNLKAADGSAALRYASERGYEDIAKLLLEYGADPNLKSKNSRPLSTIS